MRREAASTANFATAMDNYSNDLQWLTTEAGVTIAPHDARSILEAQLDAWDKVLPALMEDPFFAKVVESQKAWAKRVVYYDLYNAADYKLAYEHYFGKLRLADLIRPAVRGGSGRPGSASQRRGYAWPVS